MTDKQQLSNLIKAEALRLGFSACGIARAAAVDPHTAATLRAWLESRGNADMDYMGNYMDKRLDPRLLMPEVKSIVCVALNYAPARRMPEDEYQIAAYAYGKDYHDVMKAKLRELVARIEERFSGSGKRGAGNEDGFSRSEERGAGSEDGFSRSEEWGAGSEDTLYNNEAGTSHSPLLAPRSSFPAPHSSKTFPLSSVRIFVDTAPVLERYWAEQAGLGWIGRNRQLIIPHAGSMFVLGEVFLDIELAYDHPMENRCGNCHQCVDACPTKALSVHPFNAAKCLSYQLIENRGELSEEAKASMGNTIYGCDRCQLACPWNRFARPTDEPAFLPSDELLSMTREKWNSLTPDDYRRLFKGSAVKRAKYDGLMRNIKAQNKNER